MMLESWCNITAPHVLILRIENSIFATFYLKQIENKQKQSEAQIQNQSEM